jgi:hypothetical protein
MPAKTVIILDKKRMVSLKLLNAKIDKRKMLKKISNLNSSVIASYLFIAKKIETPVNMIYNKILFKMLNLSRLWSNSILLLITEMSINKATSNTRTLIPSSLGTNTGSIHFEQNRNGRTKKNPTISILIREKEDLNKKESFIKLVPRILCYLLK